MKFWTVGTNHGHSLASHIMVAYNNLQFILNVPFHLSADGIDKVCMCVYLYVYVMFLCHLQ